MQQLSTVVAEPKLGGLLHAFASLSVEWGCHGILLTELLWGLLVAWLHTVGSQDAVVMIPAAVVVESRGDLSRWEGSSYRRWDSLKTGKFRNSERGGTGLPSLSAGLCLTSSHQAPWAARLARWEDGGGRDTPGEQRAGRAPSSSLPLWRLQED